MERHWSAWSLTGQTRSQMPCYLESSKVRLNMDVYAKLGFVPSLELCCDDGGENRTLYAMVRQPTKIRQGATLLLPGTTQYSRQHHKTKANATSERGFFFHVRHARVRWSRIAVMLTFKAVRLDSRDTHHPSPVVLSTASRKRDNNPVSAAL